MQTPTWCVLAALAGALLIAPDEPLPVYQDLEEATSRIARLGDKPTVDLARDGIFQTETLIFHDVETGKEVWSLTREQCVEMASIERRCAWGCDGQFISFTGNRVFWNLTNNQLWKRAWSGYHYVANADGSGFRHLWGNDGGRLLFHHDKFNNWDQRRPNVLYYADPPEALWRVTLGRGEQDNRSEAIYRFENPRASKIIQDVSDDNLLVVEEMDKPRFTLHVFDANRDPSDPRFHFSQPLEKTIHPGSCRWAREARLVHGGYEGGGGFRFLLDPEKGLVPVPPAAEDPFGVRMAHLWYGPPDDRVAFSGSVRGKGTGLFVQLPGKEPVLAARVPDGHPTWCGRDPEWFFYAIGPGEMPEEFRRLDRRLVAGSADGTRVVPICTPYDRRRGGQGGYHSIPRPNQSPDGTKCWFHSSMLMPSDDFTGSYVAVFRRPYPPNGLRLAPGEGVVLAWTPHALSREVKGYRVYRAEGSGALQELTREPVNGSTFTDRTAAAGKVFHYAVTAQEWSGLESGVTSGVLSVRVGANGRAETSGTGPGVSGWDRTAPAQPPDLTVARVGAGRYRLAWGALPSPDVRYYNVYFSSEGPPSPVQARRVVSPPRSSTSYLDWTAPLSGPAHYALTAVDRQGNESAPTYAGVVR